ncbi:hypothetical protein [Aliiglaciecola litoralis]
MSKLLGVSAYNKFVKFAQQVGLGRVNCTRPLQKRYISWLELIDVAV